MNLDIMLNRCYIIILCIKRKYRSKREVNGHQLSCCEGIFQIDILCAVLLCPHSAVQPRTCPIYYTRERPRFEVGIAGWPVKTTTEMRFRLVDILYFIITFLTKKKKRLYPDRCAPFFLYPPTSTIRRRVISASTYYRFKNYVFE